MKKAIVIAGIIACAPLLSGCLIADVAGAAIGVTSAAVGGVVDLVTTDEDERQSQDIEKLKKENEELRRQQAEQAKQKQ